MKCKVIDKSNSTVGDGRQQSNILADIANIKNIKNNV